MSERFRRVNLAEVEDIKRETLFHGMFYRGLNSKIVGPTGAGKTIFAIGTIIHVLREEGLKPVHLDMEIGEGGSKSTYRGYGATNEELSRINYVPFPEPQIKETAELVRSILDAGEDFAVFDKKPDFLRSLGLEENSNDHQSEFYGRLIDPLREKVTTVILAPTGHSGDFGKGARGRGGSESDYKYDTIWQLSVVTPFDRDKIGRISLLCTKDRWGYIGRDRVVEFEVGGDGAGNIVLNYIASGAAGPGAASRADDRESYLSEKLVEAGRAIAPDAAHETSPAKLFEWLDAHVSDGKRGNKMERGMALHRAARRDPTLDRLVARDTGRKTGLNVVYAYHFEEAVDA